MKDLSIANLEVYLKAIYTPWAAEQSMFMKLVEEMGEVAEVLNIRAKRKAGDTASDEALAKELVDVIHYTDAIAAINHIDLAAAILEKDKQASAKYNRSFDLYAFLQKKADSL